MTIKFTKMHGLGNDFMVIDAIHQPFDLQTEQIIALAKRDTGIGFDQCLVVEPPKATDCDFYYRIFNADGQEVGQCGNGARCLARFIQHYGLSPKKNLSVATFSAKMQLILNEDKSVTLSLAPPKLAPAEIPLLAAQQETFYEIPLHNGKTWPVHALNLGNPHAVSVLKDIEELAVEQLGKELSEHPLFPEQINAGFMQLIDATHIRLRVYERGSGETQACGSGAVAAAAVGRLYYGLAEEIHISLPGGELVVNWPDLDGPIYLTGPASFVYEGELMPCV